MDELPQYEFDKCVCRYRGDYRVRSLSSYQQFRVMGFAQLTYRESLRDIETCLRALGPKLYHSGIGQPTARSTLADANEKRDGRIFADFAHVLIEQARWLYADEPFGAELKQAAYALDSTTIDLSTVPLPLADRTVLQMDQTPSAHQSLLGHFRERRADPGLDRHRRLCPGRHSQKAVPPLGQPLHHATDSEPDAFRENAHFTGPFSTTTTNDYA